MKDIIGKLMILMIIVIIASAAYSQGKHNTIVDLQNKCLTEQQNKPYVEAIEICKEMVKL